ncbi:hypothetical protein NQ315_016790 [Exocentrus adspersus]|uniref:Uncharacterized protein n=1 Tax=Exocentrus adspersus TaxID=1586481 RepID=A0AAV8VXA6_9CUCU|nr:hypothetical protein NQ315_016790 [Exocentrus adspersus]
MKVFVVLLLLPLLVTCYTVEDVENYKSQLAKRGLDHSSNIALLNSINFADNTKPIADFNSGTAAAVPTPSTGTTPVTVNTENLAVGNPNAVQFAYAPSYPQNLPLIQAAAPNNNLLYLSQPQVLPFVNVLTPLAQDNGNLIQNYVPQNLVQAPQVPQTIQLIREVKVPQPYPVHITRTVQVPVQVRVPVEVPKPYPVRVPHPVPVPVHIKVPVPVEKPYPVQITKTVAVPVEKPVYIKVPQPIQVPVAQPYPVGLPHALQVQVPFLIRVPDEIDNSNGVGTPALPEINSLLLDRYPSPLPGHRLNVPLRGLLPIKGNGLVPPDPPSDPGDVKDGLLKSYVSSREGGVHRRSTEYQTREYKKTW